MEFLKSKVSNIRTKMQEKVGNQKGLTMIELMFVLLVIAIIIAVIVGVGSNGTDKARETGVKSDFKAFSDASEMYLVQEVGKKLTISGFNGEIDAQFAVTEATPGAGTGESVKEDPWKTPYTVSVNSIDTSAKTAASVVIESGGKTGGDDFTAAVYYFDGKSARCTYSSTDEEAEDAVNTVNSVFPSATFDIKTDCGKELSL